MSTNRRGRGNGGRPGVRQELKAFERRVQGFKAAPRSIEPTNIVVYPWNSLVYVVNNILTVAATSVTTVGHLQDHVRTVYGIPSSKEIVVKISSAQAWVCGAIPGSVNTPHLTFHAYDLGTGNIRSQQTDTGSLGRPARAGYVWPISDAKELFGSTDSAKNVVHVNSSSTVNLSNTKHVHFMWNVVGPDDN